jgi:hypothetical protein
LCDGGAGGSIGGGGKTAAVGWGEGRRDTGRQADQLAVCGPGGGGGLGCVGLCRAMLGLVGLGWATLLDYIGLC